MRERLTDAVKAIPTGKHFQAGVAVTRDGYGAEVGYKPKSWLDISGYAGRQWGKAGWTGAAKVGISF